MSWIVFSTECLTRWYVVKKRGTFACRLTFGGIFLFYCGIDIAKNKHEASIIDSKGKELSKSISFQNNREGCQKLLNLFENFEISTENIVIGMEATGHYWLAV